MILTIIVPVFNTREYLGRCLLSLLSAGYPGQRYEIVVIDDGSSDGSAEAVEDLQAKWSNIRLIRQKNAGVGAARNAGLDSALGEYVWFVDSDDYITPNALVDVFSAIGNFSPDIIPLEWKCVDQAGNVIRWVEMNIDSPEGVPISGGDYYYSNYRNNQGCFFVFRRSLFDRDNLYFNTSILLEDAELLPKLMGKADSVVYCRIDAYRYMKRHNSIVNSRLVNSNFALLKSMIAVLRSAEDLQKDLDCSGAMFAALQSRIALLKSVIFLDYTYREIDSCMAQKVLSDLREAGVFPFRYHGEMRSGRAVLHSWVMTLVNLFPIRGRGLVSNLYAIYSRCVTYIRFRSSST